MRKCCPKLQSPAVKVYARRRPIFVVFSNKFARILQLTKNAPCLHTPALGAMELLGVDSPAGIVYLVQMLIPLCYPKRL
jgi:hypothetical protein